MSAKPTPSRKVVGCCGEMFNNHTYPNLPFEVKSARPNFKKYPDLRLRTAMMGCHACGWYGIRSRASMKRVGVGHANFIGLVCPHCGHQLQYANLSKAQSLLLAP